MPNRILKDSLCRSDSVAELSWFEQCVFVRLIVLADDYGRYDARPAIIKGSGFPLSDDVTTEMIDSALLRIEAAGMLKLYYVDGKRYLQLISWEKHQRVRNSKMKYPAEPSDEYPQVAASCGELPRNAAQSNPIQSESNTNPESNPIQSEIESNPNKESISKSISNPTIDASEKNRDDFQRFWFAYPKRVRKHDAGEAFKSVDVPVDVLISAIEKQKQSRQWQQDGGRYIPTPENWLLGRRWEDDLEGIPSGETTGFSPGKEEIEIVRRMHGIE